MCRSKNVSLVQEDSDTDSEDTHVISSVSKNKNKKGSRAKAAVTKIHISKQKNENIVAIQIDAEVQCTIPPAETYVRVTGDTVYFLSEDDEDSKIPLFARLLSLSY